MARLTKTFSFSQSANFAVQWRHDGGLRVVAAPFLKGENPFLVWTGSNIVNLLRAVDITSEAFFANVGRVYEKQFGQLAKDAQRTVKFPVVEFSVSVRGRVVVATREIIEGEGEAKSRVVGLNGRTRDVSVVKSIAGLPARPHPLMSSAKTTQCFAPTWEIEGHPDPNCEWHWSGCSCNGPCCTHIVMDGFGVCWTEKCAWGWLWMACGCHHDKIIPCPKC